MSVLNWSKCSDCGPKLAFHAGAIVGNCLIVHGGIQTCTTEDVHVQPLSQTYAFDLTRSEWRTLPSGPALSHHCCIATNDNKLIFIGGWDGHERRSDIHIFDVTAQIWSHPTTTGFPNGAGLSSHTASVLKNGDILIVGREGSLRTQRRAGNAFRLTHVPNKLEYRYVKEPVSVQSRSGHTALICGRTLFLIGGRRDFRELHDGYSSGARRSSLVTQLCSIVRDDSLLHRPPYSRKNHVTVAGNDGFLIHGGFVFDGKVKQTATSDMLLCKCDGRDDSLGFKVYRLPLADDGRQCARAAHVLGYDDERVYIHGGLTSDNIVCGDVFCLAAT